MDYASQAEWDLKGEELFGSNKMKWKFKCPICGNTQTPADFKEYKGKGAKPSSAVDQCIGRYKGGDIGRNLNGDKQPCDYAAFGLFKLGDTVKDGDKTITIFPFS